MFEMNNKGILMFIMYCFIIIYLLLYYYFITIILLLLFYYYYWFIIICNMYLQAVEISEASPAWQEYVDYIDAIVLNGLKQSSLTSLQSMLKQIVTSNMNQV